MKSLEKRQRDWIFFRRTNKHIFRRYRCRNIKQIRQISVEKGLLVKISVVMTRRKRNSWHERQKSYRHGKSSS